MEPVGHRSQQKVHGAQAQNGEHIAGQHDKRVVGDGENGGDGVHRKNHIGERNQADDHEQRRGNFSAVFHGPEVLSVVALAHRQQLAQQLEGGVVVQVGLLAGGPPHLHASEHQKRAEHIQHPVELGQQPAPHQDHDGAQHDGANDADHQHPLLERRGHRKVGEDQQKDKDVVHRQRLFNQVTGQKLQRLGVGHLHRAGGVFDGPPKQAVKHKAERNPDQRPIERRLDAYVLRTLLFQHHKINEQRHQHNAAESSPEPERSNGLHESPLQVEMMSG